MGFRAIFWGGVIQNSAVAPITEAVVHAIDLIAHLIVLDIFADRGGDSREFVPLAPCACALFLISYGSWDARAILWE
jgi:hypothetical protein